MSDQTGICISLLFNALCICIQYRLATLDILLINTKVPRSSKKLIAGVREKHDMVCVYIYAYTCVCVYSMCVHVCVCVYVCVCLYVCMCVRA